jgi:RHS repeat-associated protein
MAVYQRSYQALSQFNLYKESVRLIEQHIYGSDRIGSRKCNVLVYEDVFSISAIDSNTHRFTGKGTPLVSEEDGTPGNEGRGPVASPAVHVVAGSGNHLAEQYQRTLGDKRYELKNHLGNVLSVITDRKIAVDNVSYVPGNGTYISAPSNNQLYLQVTTGTFIQMSNPDLKVDYYTAEIVKSTEYSCYGVELNEWGYINVESYRYGFQDQETDKELWGGAVSYLYRIEDPRLGRFFSVDPLAPEYAYNSPYAFSENRVLDGIELEGAEFEPINENGATVDYRYVGYNDDGTPVAGSVSGGYLEGELGGMKWTKTFSSNASTRSGTLVHTQELASGAANVYPGPMGSSEGLHAPSQGMSYLAWNSATITFRGSNSYPDIEYSFSSTGGIYSGSGGICGDELQEHCTTEEWPVGRTTIGSANLSGDGLLELMESDWRRGVGERCFIHIPSDAILYDNTLELALFPMPKIMSLFKTTKPYPSSRILGWGDNAKGHLIKHADVLGFGGYTPQQLQKMLPQLRGAANQLLNKADASLTRVGKWHGHNNAIMHVANGKMLVTEANGTFITVINKTSNQWYNAAKPLK